MGSVGRPAAFTSKEYLDAVKKIRDITDSRIARVLGCSRKTIYRYRVDPDNKEIIEEANKIVLDFEGVSFSSKLENFDYFFNEPIIQEWYRVLKEVRRVKEATTMRYIRSFWAVCKTLKKHPKNIRIDECATLNNKIKRLYYAGEKLPEGLNYQGLRECIRSYFMVIIGISGAILSQKGVSKENLPTYGRFSKQFVKAEIRVNFEKVLGKHIDDYDKYLELVNIAKFMFYTGTRISAALMFRFSINRYELDKKIWMLEVIDKGRGLGVKWEKYLIGHALDEFKVYLSKRFKIPIEKLEDEIVNKTDTMFPNYSNGYSSQTVSKMYRLVLRESGLKYKSFPPTHIWRHTFAQLFLRSTDWNYDLCASIGGWKSTYVLKQAYGEMGFDPKIKGLRKAMGLPIEEVEYELRWDSDIKIEAITEMN